MSKKSPAIKLMPAIDEAIKSMVDEGKLATINQKYLLMEQAK
jgi:hypothetical protein